MAIGAVVGKAAKKVKKPLAKTMEETQKRSASDYAGKAKGSNKVDMSGKSDKPKKAPKAKAKPKTKKVKEAPKQLPTTQGSKEMMGGNKPLATTKPKSMSRASAGPKRMEKVVKGEVVEGPKGPIKMDEKGWPKGTERWAAKAGDKTAPKTDAGSTRKGINKKSVAGVAAAATLGAAGIATMDKKKTAPEKASEKFNMVEHAKKTKASSPGKKAPSEFGKAFQSARKAGKKDEAFEYKGKKYHKYTKEEVVKMSPEEKKALRKKGVYV